MKYYDLVFEVGIEMIHLMGLTYSRLFLGCH